MSDSVLHLCATINAGLAGYLEEVAARLHKWVDPLSEGQFWRNPFPYGNDIGHLVLHLTGNLNYYIGAQIAQTGYVRDRDKEFTDKQPPTKAEALERFDRAIALVADTIRKQSADDWSAFYTGRGVSAANRFAAVLDSTAHADHHLGQIIHVARELAR